MKAKFSLEASKSTGDIRVAVDLSVNLAAILTIFGRLF